MKKMKFQNLLALGAASALAASASAQTFSLETIATDGSNISTSGVQSTVGAWSLGGGSGSVTVQGISFTETSGSSGDFKHGFAGSSDLTTSGATNNYTGNMATLMEGFSFSDGSGVGGALRVSIENLSVGQDYRLQMLHDRGFTDDMQVDFYGSDFTNPIVTSSSVFTVRDTGVTEGTLSTFEWTAGSSTQRWEIAAVSGRAALNGLVVQAIPEPSSYAAIGGLLALGAVLLRRRVRK